MNAYEIARSLEQIVLSYGHMLTVNQLASLYASIELLDTRADLTDSKNVEYWAEEGRKEALRKRKDGML